MKRIVLAGVVFGATFLLQQMEVTRDFGGSFPVVIEGSDQSSVLALTAGKTPIGVGHALSGILTGTPYVRPQSMLEGAQLLPATDGNASLMESAEAGAAAAWNLLEEPLPLKVAADGGGVGEGLRVVELNGMPADVAAWTDARERLLDQIVAEGVGEAHLWEQEAVLEDGTVLKIRAGAGMTLVTAVTEMQLAMENEDGRLRRIEDGYQYVLLTYPALEADAPEEAYPLAPARTSGYSAGLAYALAYLDRYVQGDLIGNRLIAATGVIGHDGRVSPVAGIRAKSAAARSAGADLLLVAEGSEGEAVMPEHRVNSLSEAVTLLCQGAPARRRETQAMCAAAAPGGAVGRVEGTMNQAR